MITTAHEFETIPTWTTVAGGAPDQSIREITVELLKALDTVSSTTDTQSMWRELAAAEDDNDILEVSQEALTLFGEEANLPPSTDVVWSEQDNAYIVTPYVDEDLVRVEECPEDYNGEDEILVVNDHGNVSLFSWDHGRDAYTEQWAMV